MAKKKLLKQQRNKMKVAKAKVVAKLKSQLAKIKTVKREKAALLKKQHAQLRAAARKARAAKRAAKAAAGNSLSDLKKVYSVQEMKRAAATIKAHAAQRAAMEKVRAALRRQLAHIHRMRLKEKALMAKNLNVVRKKHNANVHKFDKQHAKVQKAMARLSKVLKPR